MKASHSHFPARPILTISATFRNNLIFLILYHHQVSDEYCKHLTWEISTVFIYFSRKKGFYEIRSGKPLCGLVKSDESILKAHNLRSFGHLLRRTSGRPRIFWKDRPGGIQEAGYGLKQKIINLRARPHPA